MFLRSIRCRGKRLRYQKRYSREAGSSAAMSASIPGSPVACAWGSNSWRASATRCAHRGRPQLQRGYVIDRDPAALLPLGPALPTATGLGTATPARSIRLVDQHKALSAAQGNPAVLASHSTRRPVKHAACHQRAQTPPCVTASGWHGTCHASFLAPGATRWRKAVDGRRGKDCRADDDREGGPDHHARRGRRVDRRYPAGAGGASRGTSLGHP